MQANTERTRDRILDGAVRAIALHGLAKLGMSDVSDSAGVSRGTLYRYFATRELLLQSLAARESRRFEQVVRKALANTPEGVERLRVVLQHATRHVRGHPALQRLLDSELEFVMLYLREQFPVIRATMRKLLAPILRETELVRRGTATSDDLVDWLARMIISAVLFPDPNPERMVTALTGVYQALSASTAPERRAPRRRPPRKKG